MEQKLKSKIIASVLVFILVLGTVLSIAAPAFADESDSGHAVDIELACLTPLDKAVCLGVGYGREFVVTSVEDAAYIRLIPHLSINEQDTEKEYLAPTDDRWFLAKDGWWYLKTPIGGSQTSIFDTEFTLAGDEAFLDAIESGSKVELTEVITAEAIQAWNTEPNWDADSPWEGAFKGEGIPNSDTETTNTTQSAFPETGDNPYLWGVIVAAALGGLVVLVAREKMSRDKENENDKE